MKHALFKRQCNCPQKDSETLVLTMNRESPLLIDSDKRNGEAVIQYGLPISQLG